VPPTQRSYLLFALLCAGYGAFCAWAALTRAFGLEVPPLVMYCVAFLFGLTAVRLMQLRANADSPGFGFAFLFCGAMAAIGGWIAFGPGPRACTGSAGAIEGSMSGLGCRVPFGIGALICATIAVVCGTRAVRSWRAPGGAGQ
jgi:hypothetical protein